MIWDVGPASGPQAQSQPPFLPVPDVVRARAAGPSASDLRRGLLVVGLGLIPGLGQEQPPVHRGGGPVGDRVHADPDLALAPLAQRPQYIRATPGDAVPSLGNPVSSIASASGSTKSPAHTANRRRTSTWSQVEVVTNCWSCWWSTPSRSAMGCIDLRLPSRINPRRYSSPFPRWSRRANPRNIPAVKSSITGRTRSIFSGVTGQEDHMSILTYQSPTRACRTTPARSCDSTACSPTSRPRNTNSSTTLH